MESLTARPPRISNIKAHFRLTSPVLPNSFFLVLGEEDVHKLVRHANFTVYRPLARLTFTLFHSSTHVNVTGVSSYTLLEKAVAFFNATFKTRVCTADVCIDNITASGSLRVNHKPAINLREIERRIVTSSTTDCGSFSLRADFFPGAVLRKPDHSTVILFASGKFVIVGSKSPWAIQEAFLRLLVLIQQTTCSTMTTQATLSV